MPTKAAFRPRPSRTTPRLQKHLDTLDFDTLAGYKRWCYQNGFRPTLDKSDEDLLTECSLATELNRAQGSSPHRHHRPARAEQITRMHENPTADFKTIGFMGRYVVAFSRLADNPEAGNALYRLFIHAEKHAGLFDGLKYRRRRYLVGTFADLAEIHQQWIRPVETWFPQSEDNIKEFSGLVRHLLAKYDIPRFLDRVWLRDPHDPLIECFRDWYLHIASGQNIRTAKNFTVHFTKRMAHLFLQAPDRSIEYAIRWAQIRALGGSGELAKAVTGTRLGETFENEDFWFTVIQFFVNNPMLDTTQVGPIVDYVYNQKYVPREIAQPGGGVVQGPPLHPGFAIKSRSADKLVRLVEEWHGDLAADAYVPFREWQLCDIRPFEKTEQGTDGQTRTWTIHELRTSWELAMEGKALHHCVRSYAKRCVSGKVSIWSTQVQAGSDDPEPVLTIAVVNVDKRVTQHRGKYNLSPNGKRASKRKDISTSYFEMLDDAGRMMRLWMEREQLRLR